MCNRERWYDRNFTIAYREGLLENRMKAFKFGGSRGWGLIFARVLLGFLNEHWFEFGAHDLIVANPTYTRHGAAAPQNDPRFVLITAAELDTGIWPFDVASPAAIAKNRETAPMKAKTWRQREEIAASELRAALIVPDPKRTKDKRIVVFDDLYTTGHTLNEVARCLIENGARQVTGLSLARQIRQGP
jgi:predicted amidophosphoribosyltransferase